MKRRNFMIQAGALAAAPLIAEQAAELIDCNMHFGPHPTRALPTIDEVFLVRQGVTEAWVGSFEALLHRDIAGVNSRTARHCAGSRRLRAVGSLHPGLPSWKDDLRRCAEHHGMQVLRLYPNHHGYTLADPLFCEVLEACVEARLAVQVVAQMEDARTQSPLMQLPAVDLKPLAKAMEKVPEVRLMVLNANATMITTSLRGCSRAWIDIAMIEGVAGVENILRSWPEAQVCFGSHAPFFYWEASSLKMKESILSTSQSNAVKAANARQWLLG